MNKRKLRKLIISKMKSVLLATSFEGAVLTDISADEYVLKISLIIPPGKELADLLLILPNLKQQLNALDAKVYKSDGKTIEIHFGMRDLALIKYHESLLHPNTLKITLPSAYGYTTLDFSDGASCHLLNGGSARMGKTSFLLYLSTCLYLQNPYSIRLFISSTKPKDFYPLNGLPNVEITKSESELSTTLSILINEYQSRDELLNTPALRKATDAKDIYTHYPQFYPQFHPIFLIIDEYARYADNKEIQKKVTELVETAGYVNVHVIIASQRPDAKTVLPARVKANLLARICFNVADENNSIVILDQKGAESLERIQGRALFLDGSLTMIQIPYLHHVHADQLLTTYRHVPRETITQGSANHASNKSEERPSNHDLADKIQDMFTQSNRIDIL